jgi:alkylated DNA repair dioxygenase AlkB
MIAAGDELNQKSLFPEANVTKGLLPDGFRYETEFLTASEETELASRIGRLEFQPFEFHGYFGNRRVVSFGFRYDYSRRAVLSAEEVPSWLEELRRKVAAFAERVPEDFQQVGVNEYGEGAGIGWHRDKPEFGDIVGVSLGSEATLRLRRESGGKWLRASQILEPRSVYLLRGEVREIWEHSIPPAAALPYSVMFRTLAGTTSRARDSGAVLDRANHQAC